ncbi:MAG: RagB/SusD family nutrient uptake outer membrane protein [Dysgonamonadaceae bacterium]|jgi:hypothetical protein|nr:RagB/SusD family nutrient uptake outer membrane protein [Dysgonamonadaceae bacterium]
MKTILSFFLLSVLFVACNDLDLIPVGSITGSNILKTDNDAIALTNGIYVIHASMSPRIAYMTDLAADATQSGEAVLSESGALLGIYTYGPGNGHVLSIWTFIYQGISTANSVIDRLDASTAVSEPLKTRLIGEAKFHRALFYYYAVQFWGDVPLILHPTEGQGGVRTKVDEVYRQIVEDLTDAAKPEVLPVSYPEKEKGRVTNGAAYALLAKTYLVWTQTSAGAPSDGYNKAVEAAEKVKGYELQEDFLENWSTVNRDGKENIFSAHHAITGNNHLCHCAFSNGFTNATPHLVVSNISFYHQFDDRDQRKAATYAKRLWDETKGDYFEFTLPRFQKYIDPLHLQTIVKTMDVDRTILRYSDVLLTKAEAINERDHGPSADNSAAYQAINQVRRRAFNREPDPSAFDLKGLNYEQFREAVRKERFFEFTYEQQRWLDLVRWKILVKTVKAVPGKEKIELKHYRFPIPQSQRDINPEGLWQNWGYDGYDEVKTGSNPYVGFE